jgi:hypothetical protein
MSSSRLGGKANVNRVSQARYNRASWERRPGSGSDADVSRCVAPVWSPGRTVARQSTARKVSGTGVARERHIVRRSWLWWRHGQDGLREALTGPEAALRKLTKHNPRHGGEERRTTTSLSRNTPAREDSAHRRPCGKRTSLESAGTGNCAAPNIIGVLGSSHRSYAPGRRPECL